NPLRTGEERHDCLTIRRPAMMGCGRPECKQNENTGAENKKRRATGPPSLTSRREALSGARAGIGPVGIAVAHEAIELLLVLGTAQVRHIGLEIATLLVEATALFVEAAHLALAVVVEGGIAALR